MTSFEYRGGELYCESTSVKLLAERFGTPLYVYSKNAIRARCRAYRDAFEGTALVCYAVKANSNLSILRWIAAEGLGMDVVSGGELERALRVGVPASRILFSGVGKRDEELLRGVQLGIHAFQVESPFELERLSEFGREKRVRVSIRINPNVDAKTIPYIATGLYKNKFGIPETELGALAQFVKKHPQIELVGVGCHLGSQILELSPFKCALDRLVAIARQLKSDGFPIEFIDMGGGLGVRYVAKDAPSIAQYARSLHSGIGKSGLRLIVEPGRSIVAEAGILLTRVIGTKTTNVKRFCIVDGAMNDLIRPSLYGAVHPIGPVREGAASGNWDVVGPICESGDFLGKDVSLPDLQKGDLVYVGVAGAYGMSMASQYNSRPRAAEVWVDGDRAEIIRTRETISDLWSKERLDAEELV